jgi:DNA-binding response OmpR family regulator
VESASAQTGKPATVTFRKHTDLSRPEPSAGERAPRKYCFVDFTLDLEGGFLWRGVEEVTLRPKAFEVLAYLVKHHGRLVSKTALTEAVWPDAASQTIRWRSVCSKSSVPWPTIRSN